MFDVEQAIKNRLAEVGREDDDRLEEKREAVRQLLDSRGPNYLLGQRQIELAKRQLELDPSDFEYTRLAEGYALIGDYEKAVEITRDDLKRKEYQEVLDALGRTECDCPKKVGENLTKFAKQNLGGRILFSCALCHKSYA